MRKTRIKLYTMFLNRPSAVAMVKWLNIRTKCCKACGRGTQDRYCLIKDACACQSAECYLRVILSFNLQYLKYERQKVVKSGVSVFVMYDACATE